MLRAVGLALGVSALLTLVVRALGMGAQRVVLGELGASAALDGYFIAMILPALVVTPIASALEIGLAPAYARIAESDRTRADVLARRFITYGVAGGVGLAISAYLLRDALVLATAPAADADQRDAAVVAASLVYPAMAAQLIGASCRAVLFGRGRFQIPIVVSVLNPIAMLVVLIPMMQFGVRAVAIASTVGFAAEAAVLLLLVSGAIRAPSDSADALDNHGLRKELVPLVVTQFLGRSIFFVDQAFVGGLDEGDLSRFSVALRLFDAVAALLVLPNARMASVRIGRAVQDTARQLREEFSRALRVGVVSSVLLATGGPAIVVLVFENGAFTRSDSIASTQIVWVFALVLVPAAAAHVGVRSLMAVGRSRIIPVLSGFQIIANVAFNAALAPLLGPSGIALSTGLVYVGLVAVQRRLVSQSVDVSSPA